MFRKCGTILFIYYFEKGNTLDMVQMLPDSYVSMIFSIFDCVIEV